LHELISQFWSDEAHRLQQEKALKADTRSGKYEEIHQFRVLFVRTGRDFLCSPGSPGTHSVTSLALNSRDLPAFVSQVLGLKSGKGLVYLVDFLKESTLCFIDSLYCFLCFYFIDFCSQFHYFLASVPSGDFASSCSRAFSFYLVHVSIGWNPPSSAFWMATFMDRFCLNLVLSWNVLFTPSMVGKVFFNDFVEYVFCAFELVFFSFFYSYYSKVGPFHGVPDFLDILCNNLLDLVFSLTDKSILSIFVYKVCYIDIFLYVEPSLHLRDEACLIMVDGLFDVFLDLVSLSCLLLLHVFASFCPRDFSLHLDDLYTCESGVLKSHKINVSLTNFGGLVVVAWLFKIETSSWLNFSCDFFLAFTHFLFKDLYDLHKVDLKVVFFCSSCVGIF
ncbi:hypothetical protein STEG23_007505, partial [Scotinomys teguina]